MMRKTIFLLILITFLSLDGEIIAQGWRQWRGPDMNGSTTTTNLPVEWSDKTNIVWNISLPGDNYSIPAIYNTNIFITSSGSYGRILLLDIAMKNGTTVWENEIARIEDQENKSLLDSITSIPPIANPRCVWAFFRTGDIVAFNHDGDTLWSKNLNKESHISQKLSFEHSCFLLYDEKLYLITETEKEHQLLLICFDAEEGRFQWIKEVSTAKSTGECSLLSYANMSTQQLILSYSGGTIALSPKDGSLIWKYEWTSSDNSLIPAVPSEEQEILIIPIIAEKRIIAVKPKAIKNNLKKEDILWEIKTDSLSKQVLPACYEEKLYYLETPAKLTCRDSKTGKQLWSGQFDPSETFDSPLLAADHKIYCISNQGTVFITGTDDHFEIIACLKMDEPHHKTSPVASNQRLFIRNDSKFYCIKNRRWIRFMDNVFLD
ncbi:MAG: PQQ-binding-like beta-propeller repeat protein [Verrucomicrobia bacterium]|nr:PQQ-binding-like beta-propeller repeat protein [Verrucomicrobiota bacterium]